MTNKELQIAFEIEAKGSYINIGDKPLSKEIEFWLNQGLEKFVKTRYSGVNFKRESFEQSEKRTDDLRTLVVTVKLYAEDNAFPDNDGTYYIELPENYMFLLGDKTGLLPNSDEAYECWKTDSEGRYIELFTDPIQATIDNIDFKLENSLSDHRYRKGKAKPLRLIEGDKIFYYTDNNYLVNSVIVKYLKFPQHLDIHTNPNEQYTDMPEHTHQEIVKLAVQAYLENKTNPRYQSFNNEVVTME